MMTTSSLIARARTVATSATTLGSKKGVELADDARTLLHEASDLNEAETKFEQARLRNDDAEGKRVMPIMARPIGIRKIEARIAIEKAVDLLEKAEAMVASCQKTDEAKAREDAEIEAITAKKKANAGRIAELQREIGNQRNPPGLLRVFRTELKQLLAA